jgi:hypothetical protein
VTVRGVIQFVGYIVRIYGRHARINVKRNGVLAALRPSLRARHAGMGRGVRVNPFRRAHDRASDASYCAMDLVRSLRLERGEVFV